MLVDGMKPKTLNELLASQPMKGLMHMAGSAFLTMELSKIRKEFEKLNKNLERLEQKGEKLCMILNDIWKETDIK